MKNFSEKIPVAGDYVAEFSFRPFMTAGGIRYHVSVKGEDGQTCFFTMQVKAAGWKIIDAPKVPHWILGAENELHRAILENFMN